MFKAAQRFLIVLIAFAIVGGTTEQLARSGQFAVPVPMAGMPCDMTMPAADSRQGEPPVANDGMPCKGMTPDCIKQMGCVTVTALPAQILGGDVGVRFSTVDYWTARPIWAGRIREPEPLPPRTA